MSAAEIAKFEFVTVSIKGDRCYADCSKCQMGMDVGESFGGIPGEEMIAQFVGQHAHMKRQAKK